MENLYHLYWCYLWRYSIEESVIELVEERIRNYPDSPTAQSQILESSKMITYMHIQVFCTYDLWVFLNEDITGYHGDISWEISNLM